VEDRSCGEQILRCPEGLLHGAKLLVAEHDLEPVEIGVGAQHEDAVEPLLLLDLVGIDREVLVGDRLQVAPKVGMPTSALSPLTHLRQYELPNN
jgi:hypothetical protein